MNSFIEWAGKYKKELPVYTQDENTRRAGIAHWAYPDGYIRSHYPDLYFTPTAADAAQKMGSHHPSHKTPSNKALGGGGSMPD